MEKREKQNRGEKLNRGEKRPRKDDLGQKKAKALVAIIRSRGPRLETKKPGVEAAPRAKKPGRAVLRIKILGERRPEEVAQGKKRPGEALSKIERLGVAAPGEEKAGEKASRVGEPAF